MKIIQKLLLVIATVLTATIFYNYPKLNIISGYSAKYASSSVFVANRTLEFTDTKDLAFSPVNLAVDEINTTEKSSKASTFGLLTRKAVYREGLGSVLVVGDSKPSEKTLVPKRSKPDNTTPFPYGNAEPKDSVFSTIDYTKLNEAINTIFQDSIQTRAVVVVYKDKIIVEKYAEGFSKNSRILGWSMTKSIVSTLFGILQCQGKIDVQVKAPIAEWQNDERKNISIHNLLQMNSGLAWEEDYSGISDVTEMLFLSKDMTKVQIDRPLVGKPNETWNYSSGTSNVLSGILRQQFKTHQEYLDFWYTALIDKIGMNSMLIETDMAGNYVASSYAWATPRDWAKFGLLYLHKGNWNGEHLFDKDWVTYATTPTPTSDGWYGAQIWLNAGGRYPDVPKNLFSFNGYQGQNVFIIPDKDLVIVRMGLTKKANDNQFLSSVIKAIR